jgi:S1-C subfamily serine protease
VGDIILGVGAEPVHTQAQFYERVWNRRHAGDEVPLKVLQGVDVKEIKVRSIDRVEYFRPRSTI